MLFRSDAADFYKQIGQKILLNQNAIAFGEIARVTLIFALVRNANKSKYKSNLLINPRQTALIVSFSSHICF